MVYYQRNEILLKRVLARLQHKLKQPMEKSLPTIILHSDLHLESGPFTLPTPPSALAVAVFAGDVCSGDGGPAALRALTRLPTVYVAGNHEFWGGDYYERLAQIKAQAKANGVHFLENQSVVLEGVRFLGATLWTDYGGGHDALLSYGLWRMNDHRKIMAARWWTPANTAKFIKQFGEQALEQFEGKFNPLMARELHKKTRAWLKRELAKPFDGPTVVVTHHAPSFQSLRLAGISEYALNKDAWVRRMNDDLNLTKVGSYASELLDDFEDLLAKAGVRLWCHGHLHHAMHYGAHGLEVAVNPRGRVHAPLTKESAHAFALFGYGVSDEQIERSQQEHRENPERGDGFGHEKTFSLSLADTGYALIAGEHEKVMASLTERLQELKDLKSIARLKRVAVADLAGHRADSVMAAVLKDVRDFCTLMLAQLSCRHFRAHKELSWLLSDCKLAGFQEFAGLENKGTMESVLVWRRLDEERSEEERKIFGFRPEHYTAKRHLEGIITDVQKLHGALKRAPQACLKLRKEYRAASLRMRY